MELDDILKREDVPEDVKKFLIDQNRDKINLEIEALQSKVGYFKIASDVSIALNTPETNLDDVAEIILKGLNLYGSNIGILDKDENCLYVKAASTPWPNLIKTAMKSVKFDFNENKKAADIFYSLDRSTRITDEVLSDLILQEKDVPSRFLKPLLKYMSGNLFGEMLLSPLFNHKKERIGALLISKKKYNSFNKSEVALVDEILANNIALAIDRRHREEENASLQEQIIQAQKMESIGYLAGGIAHDFNNMLASISGYADLIRMQIWGKTKTGFSAESCEKQAGNILQSVGRAKDLVGKILGFARKGKYNPQNINLNTITKEAIDVTKKGFSSTVNYEIESSLDSTKNIYADSTQMLQVIQNIAINARDAMPEGGKIWVNVKDKTLRRTMVTKYHKIPEGEYVMLSIADSGTGISDTNLKKIFDPLFTTKDMDSMKGTGLGLSNVWGIVENHKGYIDVTTYMCVGSTFDIYFPAVEREKPKLENVVEARSGKGTILFVDDEEFIRDLAKDYLETVGYDVVLASGGSEGFEKFKEGDIDGVVTDLIMPNGGGEELFYNIKEADPNMNVIVTSGYEMDDKVKQILDDGASAFIQKPFMPLSILAEKVKKYLSRTD